MEMVSRREAQWQQPRQDVSNRATNGSISVNAVTSTAREESLTAAASDLLSALGPFLYVASKAELDWRVRKKQKDSFAPLQPLTPPANGIAESTQIRP